MTERDQIIHVVVTMDFSDELIELLRGTSPLLHIEQYHPNVPDSAWEKAEVLYTNRPAPTPQQAPNLKWIQLHTAGMEHMIDKPIVTERDMILTSASGIHAVPIAEYTLGMMLSWEYQFRLMWQSQKDKHWDENRYRIFAPTHLRGKTLGIVGYGSIGRELARTAHAFGMNILAVKHNAKQPADHTSYREAETGDPEGNIPDRIYPPEALKSMAAECDYLVLLMPVTDATRGMVNADIFQVMRDNAVLINSARGEVVHEPDLIAALQQGHIGGAILDVFQQEPLPPDNPLWELDNVIISPHVAGNSHRYHARAAALFAENLQRYIERRPLLNQYNRDKGY
jgi:phosphoglycerate dehydrogenase-like enzyme